MTTNKRDLVVFVSFFALCITLLLIALIDSFNYLDLAYLLFFICCFIRYIYIKITD